MIPVVICARGGSKRIPKKNIHPFCGIPLIAWTIRAAKGSRHVGEIYVSTDDDEIEVIARKEKAKIIRRPAISPDEESGIVSTVAALENIHAQTGDTIFVSCMVTNPVRRPSDIDAMIELYQTGKYPAVLCGYSPKEMILFRKINIDGGQPFLLDKGYAFWNFIMGDCIADINHFRKCLYTVEKGDELTPSETIVGIVALELWQTHDIDTLAQWEQAEYWFQKKILSQGEDCYERYRESWQKE